MYVRFVVIYNLHLYTYVRTYLPTRMVPYTNAANGILLSEFFIFFS